MPFFIPSRATDLAVSSSLLFNASTVSAKGIIADVPDFEGTGYLVMRGTDLYFMNIGDTLITKNSELNFNLNSPPNLNYQALGFLDGRIHAFDSAGGNFAYSDDFGGSWTNSTTVGGTATRVGNFATNGEVIIAVGGNGAGVGTTMSPFIRYSVDNGDNWQVPTGHEIGNSSAINAASSLYYSAAHDVFLAPFGDNTAGVKVNRSTDGINWTFSSLSTGLQGFTALAGIRGSFIRGDKLYIYTQANQFGGFTRMVFIEYDIPSGTYNTNGYIVIGNLEFGAITDSVQLGSDVFITVATFDGIIGGLFKFNGALEFVQGASGTDFYAVENIGDNLYYFGNAGVYGSLRGA